MTTSSKAYACSNTDTSGTAGQAKTINLKFWSTSDRDGEVTAATSKIAAAGDNKFASLALPVTMGQWIVEFQATAPSGQGAANIGLDTIVGKITGDSKVNNGINDFGGATNTSAGGSISAGCINAMALAMFTGYTTTSSADVTVFTGLRYQGAVSGKKFYVGFMTEALMQTAVRNLGRLTMAAAYTALAATGKCTFLGGS